MNTTPTMNTAARHSKAYARANKYGWILYRGHSVAGAMGEGWVVRAEGQAMMKGATLGECLRTIDAVVNGE